MTISVCMIVKNEEEVLARCLDSLTGIYDELIIVDTGSTDSTKSIAKKYGAKLYDFAWMGDFSDARNFAFNKAGCDYIYSADADEVIDPENRLKFMQLKQVLLPEIEIVEMYYTNQLAFNTTYNFDEELRPKLYKRLRTFTWQDPLHESVRLDPVIYDSDIRIIHAPTGNHAGRDFSLYKKALERDGSLSDHLFNMYARELYIAGDEKDFAEAVPYFSEQAEKRTTPYDIETALLVLIRAARLANDSTRMLKYSSRLFALCEGAQGLPVPAELCFELGEYFNQNGEKEEGELWFAQAKGDTEPVLSKACHDF